MAYEEVLYEVADHVATVTLNRPNKLNAWTMRMEEEVSAAMGQAAEDDGVRVIVFTGSGRGFCAGADMEMLGSLLMSGGAGLDFSKITGPAGPRKDDPDVPKDFHTKYGYFPSIPKPILAAVNGVAAGLGFVLPLYCDIRIAAENATFNTTFAKRGLIAEHGSNWMLPRLVGTANALDLFLTARTIDAAEALRIGLVNRVLPQEGFIDAVRAIAREIATTVSPRSTRVMKEQIYRSWGQSLAEGYSQSNEAMIQSFFSEDFREGVAHFLEKRPPRFSGK
ncbi:MAG: enoyl-CoA hydratase [Planctomycetota bacterium]